MTVRRHEWAAVLHRDSSYCTLPGSLTTPPCTEDELSCFLQTSVPTASRAQVAAFASRWEPSGNARPLQPVNNRPVVCYTTTGPYKQPGSAAR